MGFELNRIMKQYGVSTPGLINYSGAAAPTIPTAPTGTRPTGEDEAAKAAQATYDKQLADAEAYKKDPSAFNEMMRKYQLDQKSYDIYKSDYQNRLQNTPMYLQAQFDSGNRPVSDAMKWVTSTNKNATTGEGMGVDQYRQNIRNYAAGNPYASTQSNQDYMKRYGISGQDNYDATGSYWGNQAAAPTYGAAPLSLANQSLQNRADYYQQQRDIGYTDADLRKSAEKTFGTLPDTHWQDLVTASNRLGGTTVQGFKMPDTWDTYTAPQKIDWFNVNKVNPATIIAGGGKQTDIDWMRNNGYKYAHGGNVKTHYQTAGSVQVNPVPEQTPSTAVITEPEVDENQSVLTKIANPTSAPVAPAVVAEPKLPTTPAALPFGGERLAGIQALLASYGPKDSAYGEDLKAARTAAKAESDAFQKMLTGAMNTPEDKQSSKAEMYFRLAAAFGAPTKTGHFAENLGMVGKELGDYSKEQRASKQQKLALAMKGQEMKMTAAKDDLRTLQALAGEEMKDKRAIATELIKDYIKSGEPQSAAGKQAIDEGFKAGTPEYQKRVQEIGNMNIEGKLAQINASLAGVSLAQANLALNQEKFANQKTQQAKLSPTEVTMKKEAEDTIAIGKQSLADLKQAYALNPNSLAGGWMDKGQQWLAEAAGSKDPTIVNTRILNNLLGAQGLAKLKTTFGGNPTEGERAILLELEGIGSKTKEERAAIIKRTYKVLQDKQAREQARLDQINSGAYRTTTPIDGGND